MKQIVKHGYRQEKKNRIAVWRLEVDYELSTLYEAIEQKDGIQVERSKRKLERLRKEWEQLQG
ncbi:hypothetical protein [Bacillus altitudinis]|uniref:hypothetical protein n=1 Tax=Bacillus altitudinis TaxID=293387 RepID=UPI00061A353D|nr:hypothetical protein [Bacillus altitudinis]AKC65831.1 hypothetical protein VT48_07320 [Bacillus altitudinis]NQW95635.1 hypothetical protein [Bacillus stratosphericus]UTV34216.1 hypothetical protein NM966_07140 [Bacillus altitudinis]